MSAETMVGFFSSKAAEVFGHAVYGTPDGRKVAVTFVETVGTTKLDELGIDYKWDDAKVVGPVTTMLSEHWKRH